MWEIVQLKYGLLYLMAAKFFCQKRKEERRREDRGGEGWTGEERGEEGRKDK